jgi:hypothetical protein
VPKHFVYIQYGCGMQSEASCSLNHDITTLGAALEKSLTKKIFQTIFFLTAIL